LDAVLFGGTIDPWIGKGPTIDVILTYVFLSCDAEATDHIQRRNKDIVIFES
jgi:hypothetical protein